ncbi:Cullin-4 (AtCUL4) [Durusdinium trenchii]|uniref:Cullin-4 (AtCUL4) n=1 Tax=Durusdinium trenchii TaxID=1381693 RepID=A0ABP0P3K2_9DINO
MCHAAHGERPRFLVVTAFDSRYEVGFLCSVVNEAYCQQHGHRFRRVLLSPEDMAKLAGGRHLAWAKVALLRNLLRGRGYDGSASGDFEEDFDYLVWIDADALVLDHSVRLEDFLELPVPAMDFIIGEDMADTDLLNTGLMFFRRSQWCRELLRRWWEESDPKWHQEVCWDQTGLCRLLRQDGFGREEPWYSWAGGARYKNWKGHIFTVDCGSFNFKYLNNCGFVFHAVGERELLLSGTRNLLLKRDRLYMAVRDGFVLHGGDASTCPSEALGLLPAAEVPEAKVNLERAQQFWRCFGLSKTKKLQPPPFGWELQCLSHAWNGRPVPNKDKPCGEEDEGADAHPGRGTAPYPTTCRAGAKGVSPGRLAQHLGELPVQLGQEAGGKQIRMRFWQLCSYVSGPLPPFGPLHFTMSPGQPHPWRLEAWSPWAQHGELLEEIQEMRNWSVEAMDPELLKSLVELLRSLDFYKDFEVAFLEQSAQFYREASDCWQREKSLAEYLLLADEHLKAEEQRCDTYHLEPSTLQPLLEVLRQEVLAKKAEDLLELGFAQLVCDVQVSDLGRLYRHYKEVDALAHLRKAFGEAVRQGGRRAMQSSEDAKQVVPELVRWLGSTQEVLSLAFGNDAGSAIAQKEAFEGFLNAAPNHAAKLLTRYLDVLLRGDEVTPAEPLAFAPPARVEKESLEVRIQRALQIFRYLAAKDAFEAFFKKDLAKRLLQRSASEGELAATTWLREECGGAYTAGIEGMFQDMEISRVLAQVFHSEAKTLLEERICLSEVSVLTTGKWPSVPSSPAIKLPMPIQRLMTSFEAFYGQQHRGRSLRWCPAWGRCWLRANAAAKKELVVSHFQALVLLCFNGSDVLSYEKLQELTQIPPAELQLTLQSLSLHRTVKLLLKENPKERDVLPGETFSYHANFTHKLYRITVSQISPKEQLQEEDAVEQRVVGSRQHELDAVVIRVMKSKKRMTHQELLAEVLSSVRFPVEAAELQRRIESLIEREYLERQPPNDQGIISYIYLA